MFSHQEHVWFIGCVFNTTCPTCAFSMHWSYIAYCHLIHTPLLPLSCIGLYLVSSSQHVMFTLCFVAFCYVLCFELHFLIHLAPLMHHSPYSFLHLLPSFLLDPIVYSCQKGGEYTLECIPESFVISIWLLCISLEGEILFLVHICRGRDIPQGRCMYQGGEDIVLTRKLCFVCHFFMTILVHDQVSHVLHYVYLIAIYLFHYTCPFITCFTLRF